jgi:hypothetical protein
LTFAWRLLLRIAINLISANSQEAGWRSSVNRSYYAALGEAREFAIKNGLIMNLRRPAHEQVWQYLRNGGSERSLHRRAALEAIGDIGIILREMRVQADYKLNSPPTEDDARRASAMAERLVRRLHGL